MAQLRPTSLDTRRNPVLALPVAARLQALPPAQREALRAFCLDLATDARSRAQESWRKNKGPMAAYWKAVGAYAGHLAKVLK